jgi:hypothetical protein
VALPASLERKRWYLGVEGILGAANCWHFREWQHEAALQGVQCLGNARPGELVLLFELFSVLGEAKSSAYGRKVSEWSLVVVFSGRRQC